MEQKNEISNGFIRLFWHTGGAKSITEKNHFPALKTHETTLALFRNVGNADIHQSKTIRTKISPIEKSS
jgi:hypothetical protein